MERATAEIIRFKGLVDGCETWEEVIEVLEEMVEEIKELASQGYRIVESHDDYLWYEKE